MAYHLQTGVQVIHSGWFVVKGHCLAHLQHIPCHSPIHRHAYGGGTDCGSWKDNRRVACHHIPESARCCHLSFRVCRQLHSQHQRQEDCHRWCALHALLRFLSYEKHRDGIQCNLAYQGEGNHKDVWRIHSDVCGLHTHDTGPIHHNKCAERLLRHSQRVLHHWRCMEYDHKVGIVPLHDTVLHVRQLFNTKHQGQLAQHSAAQHSFSHAHDRSAVLLLHDSGLPYQLQRHLRFVCCPTAFPSLATTFVDNNNLWRHAML